MGGLRFSYQRIVELWFGKDKEQNETMLNVLGVGIVLIISRTSEVLC